ncbi:MAG TPA: cysteine desulfurase family protein [Gemmatimonadales bacterium]|nr:cysteine desulfurase family protein [Gemmatimonadales bacterium]
MLRTAYLDHAASAPVRAEVRDAMLPLLGELHGNPSSAHAAGRAAKTALERARRDVATAVGADPAQVFFTSGGTEADNLAVLGAVLAARRNGRAPIAVVSAVEHKAVLASAHAAASFGGGEIVLPVTASGAVDLEALDAALAERPAVVSVMWANNETGVVADIVTITARCAAAGVPFHSDAVQALRYLPMPELHPPIDLLTISGHKLGAPKGVGALVVRSRALLEPLVHGGAQQFALRPGTENVAGAVGLGVAMRLAAAERATQAPRVAMLRDTLERLLIAAVPDAQVVAAESVRVPHISAVVVPGTETSALLMHLDRLGTCASGGSACTTGSPEPSHVLQAMGLPRELALGFVRFSLGRESTEADVAQAAAAFPEAVARARRAQEALHG